MNNIQIRKKLEDLKIHIDAVEEWAFRANDMIYEIEQKIMDSEEKKLYETLDLYI